MTGASPELTRPQWGVDEALQYLRQRRPIVEPNAGFMEQVRGGCARALR